MLINADGKDYFYMGLGTFGALVTGISLPIFNVLMGEMLDTLNDSPDSFEKAIAKICIIFVILAAINVFSGFLQVYHCVCFQSFSSLGCNNLLGLGLVCGW